MKTIIVSFDGTNCNQKLAVRKKKWFWSDEHKDKSMTNVLKTHLLLGGSLDNSTNADENQVCFYYEGIGSAGGKLRRWYNQAFAPEKLDYMDSLEAAYGDVCDVFEPDDSIIVTGFSRGAALARVFAYNIVGRLPKRPKRPQFIDALICYETVAAIGTPDFDDDTVNSIKDVPFRHGTQISGHVKQALHMMALDETRVTFNMTLMNAAHNIQELWFAGVHKDIGGGYLKSGLSDITLTHALSFLKKHTTVSLLDVEQLDLSTMELDTHGATVQKDDLTINPDPNGDMHLIDDLFYKVTGDLFTMKRPVAVLRNGELQDTSLFTPILHHSIKERLDYSPKSTVAIYDILSK